MKFVVNDSTTELGEGDCCIVYMGEHFSYKNNTSVVPHAFTLRPGIDAGGAQVRTVGVAEIMDAGLWESQSR